MNRIVIGVLLMLVSLSAIVFFSQNYYKEVKLYPNGEYIIKVQPPLAIVYYKVCVGNVSLKIVNGYIVSTYGANNENITLVKSNTNSLLVFLNNDNRSMGIVKYAVEALYSDKFYEFLFSILLFIVGAGLVLVEIRK